jgi:glycine/D-amino acid oxidase-like deaminating enzyme
MTLTHASTNAATNPMADPPITPAVIRALADVEHSVFWLDQSGAPETNAPLIANTSADLLIIGGGFTGLWTAICAKEQAPDRDVVLIEAKTIAFGGSGRNGGFISASLTHGLAHGEHIWPDQMPELVQQGRENLQAIAQFAETEGIDADLRLVGKTAIALTPHAQAQLPAMLEIHQRWGEDVELLDQDKMQADVHSPTYLGGLRVRSGGGLMDPARLSWGLRASALRRGVRIYEKTKAIAINSTPTGVAVRTSVASIDANHVALATNGFTPLLRRLKYRMLPIFDHVLVTEPLSETQLDSIGWSENQGLTDMGNQFHYYRRTPDNRILWGGYDAIYHRGNNTDPRLEHRDSSHQLLAAQFLTTFPQLEGIRFSHKWAGIIDSTSRFTPAFGTAMNGRLAYAVGYTGLGTASSRFGALTMLDLLDGKATERTSLKIVKRKPFPFPPEPLRYPLVQFTRSRLAKEDRTGKRGLWLRALDHFGLGFNS